MGLIKRVYTDKETLITAENLNDIQDAVIALEDGLFTVENDKNGEVITITDASKRGFRSLSIYGRTTQDGTPTPDAPVDLVSVGDSGSITVTVTGERGSQSMTVSTPNGLPGIPVKTGGNYTDENGQQWICDEVDFARGMYIKRIERYSLAVADMNNSESFPGWTHVGIAKYYPEANNDLGNLGAWSICNIKKSSPYINTLSGNDVMLVPNHYGTTQSEWKTKYPNLIVEIMLTIPTPIETPIPEEELAAYAALYTYKDNTTVSNDSSAYMGVEYVMDAKKYFDGLAGGIHPATVE